MAMSLPGSVVHCCLMLTRNEKMHWIDAMLFWMSLPKSPLKGGCIR